jgi:hypothetical protein
LHFLQQNLKQTYFLEFFATEKPKPMKKTHKPFNQVQKLLFDQIVSLLPKQIVVAHEISDLLSLSTDAVYRRMRGEKKLNIEEICTLCDHFDISIDDLLRRKLHNVRFETVPFHSDELDNFLSHLLINRSLSGLQDPAMTRC